jgi:hypothetical protein
MFPLEYHGTKYFRSLLHKLFKIKTQQGKSNFLQIHYFIDDNKNLLVWNVPKIQNVRPLVMGLDYRQYYCCESFSLHARCLPWCCWVGGN